MKDAMRALKKRPVLLLFFGFLFGFMVLDGLWPKREFSELENKKLAQFPEFSFSSLFRNEWTAKYGDYVKEQFALRDTWIDLQSRSETLLFQKAEVGGQLLGADDMLFTKVFALKTGEVKQLPRNISAVAQFSARHPGQVTFLLAPSASLVYPEKLPFHAPMLNENAFLDDIFAEIGQSARVLDLRGLFSAHKDEYLYYRTDHHWTSGGAWLAYTEFCRQEGLVPFDPAAYTAVEVPNFYGTSYSSARTWNAVPDVITWYELPSRQTIWDVTAGPEALAVLSEDDLYNQDAFATRDKYAAFLHGNPGYSTVTGSGEGSILVIKDSYANCFVPYLTANYAKIGVLDLRNYSYSVDALMQAEGYDKVLILYNFQSFKSDGYLYNLNRDPIE